MAGHPPGHGRGSGPVYLPDGRGAGPGGGPEEGELQPPCRSSTTGPFGAKSVGEVVVNTPSPAIENAIYNGLGINLNTLPMTPEKVFMAMTNK